jgi:hypothetical protein
LTFGGNVLDNKNVVGQTEGQTNTYNGKLNLGLDRIAEQAEWENSLALDETFTRTPLIDRTIKSGDTFNLESTYKYFLLDIDWLGAFAGLKVETSAFAGYDERPDDVTYVIAKNDGVETKTEERLKLTDSMRPMTIKESAGAVIRVINEKTMQLEMRTGPGARQVLLNKQLFLADDEDTPEIEVGQYSDDLRIIGWMLITEFKGTSEDAKFTYKLYTEALMPLSYHPKNDNDPPKSKLISTEVGLSLGYKLMDWMATAYDFKAKREPLLQAKAQTSHSFMLTATLKTGGAL